MLWFQRGAKTGTCPPVYHTDRAHDQVLSTNASFDFDGPHFKGFRPPLQAVLLLHVPGLPGSQTLSSPLLLSTTEPENSVPFEIEEDAAGPFLGRPLGD